MAGRERRLARVRQATQLRTRGKAPVVKTAASATALPGSRRLWRPRASVDSHSLGPRTAAGGMRRGRKVRAPQGRVVGNAHRSREQGQCHRDQTAGRPASLATARVKRRGKSSPRSGRPDRHGKPHPEEDRIGGSRCPRSDPRVGRWRPFARTALEKWPSPLRGGTRTRLTGTKHSLASPAAPPSRERVVGVGARPRSPCRRSPRRCSPRPPAAPMLAAAARAATALAVGTTLHDGSYRERRSSSR